MHAHIVWASGQNRHSYSREREREIKSKGMTLHSSELILRKRKDSFSHASQKCYLCFFPAFPFSESDQIGNSARFIESSGVIQVNQFSCISHRKKCETNKGEWRPSQAVSSGLWSKTFALKLFTSLLISNWLRQQSTDSKSHSSSRRPTHQIPSHGRSSDVSSATGQDPYD
jgi:hypothetical protein